jgi:hypothetical protein
MMKCFKNIRQTTEKIDECVQLESEKFTYLDNSLKTIYKLHSNELDKCTDLCIDIKDLPCLIQCSDSFKQNYHMHMTEFFYHLE